MKFQLPSFKPALSLLILALAGLCPCIVGGPVRADANGKITFFSDRDGNHASPLVRTEWLPQELHSRAARSHAALGTRTSHLQLGGRELRVTNIVGYGKRMDTGAQITAPGSRWPVRITRSDDGDGTVPRE